MLKKISALILVICIAFSAAATYAADADRLLDDLDYMDDVYKYDLDLFEKESAEDSESAAMKSEAVMAVSALGIMEKTDEGKFLPNENVTLGDFASIVLKLISGSETVTEEWYANYDASQLTTQAIAAKYIVSALGYSVYERKYDTAYPEMSVAAELKLLKNVKQNPEAYITRMELAQMIYNALSVDVLKQTFFSASDDYVVEKGDTLLSEKFNAIEISGTLTAISGINIYSNASMEENRAVIDRAEYEFRSDEDYSDLLGKCVFAYAKPGERSDMYEILGIMEHALNEAIEISLDDVLSVSEKELTYKDERTKKISLEGVENVLYNGFSMKNFTFSDELPDSEGSILLGKSGESGAYDIAVIYEMESFPVLRVTGIDKKAYFKYGMKFEGLEYIDLNEDVDDKKVVVVKNGSPATVADIKPEDVISIAKSADGRYVKVLVSDNKINGTIYTTASDNAVAFDNEKSYYISKSYLEAYENAEKNGIPTDLTELKPGVTGAFHLSANGRIADCVVSGATQYAFLKSVGVVDSMSLKKAPILRLFNVNQEWKNYEVSDKLVMDGVRTDKNKAYEIMQEYKDAIVMQPIRYQLSDDGKISFLDTMIDTTDEKTDPQRMCLNYVYNDFQIDWTLGTNLRPTNYNLTNDSVLFSLPTDRENEKKYKVVRRYDLVKNDTPQLSLYSANEFGTVPVVLLEGAAYQGSWEGGWIFAVNSVLRSINEDGEEVCVVKGMIRSSSNNNEYYAEEELEVTPEALEMAPTLSKGDIFWYILNSDGAVDKMMIRIENAEYPEVDIFENPGAGQEIATGVVTAIDFKGRQIKIDVNTGTPENPEITTRVLQSGDICIYDSEMKQYYPALFADLNIGDKVLVSGLVRKITAIAFR